MYDDDDDDKDVIFLFFFLLRLIEINCFSFLFDDDAVRCINGIVQALVLLRNLDLHFMMVIMKTCISIHRFIACYVVFDVNAPILCMNRNLEFEHDDFRIDNSIILKSCTQNTHTHTHNNPQDLANFKLKIFIEPLFCSHYHRLCRFRAGSVPRGSCCCRYCWFRKSGIWVEDRSHISSDGINMDANMDVVGI